MEKSRVELAFAFVSAKRLTACISTLFAQANMDLTCTARLREVILQSVCTCQPLKICPQTSFRFQSLSVQESKQLLCLHLSWSASSAEMRQNQVHPLLFVWLDLGRLRAGNAGLWELCAALQRWDEMLL